METGGGGDGGIGGVDPDGNDLEVDYESDDPALGMGMEVPTTAASVPGARRRGRSTGRDSPGRSRSASRRRRRDEAKGNKVEGGAGRQEGGGGSA